MRRVTERDGAILEWLSTVRMADVEAVRWAMSGLAGTGRLGPVNRRNAQRWIARMHEIGLLGRGRPNYVGSQIVWATHTESSRVPNLYRQTTRHEVAVATVSARYLARGYRWGRDRRPATMQDHQADGVAVRGDQVDLVEVELTAKALPRYRGICHNHAERLTHGGVGRIVYLCTPEVARVVQREADTYLFRDLRPRLVAVPVLNVHGHWTGTDDAPWVEHLMSPTPTGLSAPGVWEGIA